MSIPVSVIIVTKNEAPRLARCLTALRDFDEIIVIDSDSKDSTVYIAQRFGATVIPFAWNGQYPKKRQWALDHVPRQHDWIFFVDADEEVTPELTKEIATLMANRPQCAGYFIRGDYVLNGHRLRRGLANNKLALFDARVFHFPVIDDLDLPGMGEIEGHYQPMPRTSGAHIGQLREPLHHHAHDDPAGWLARHRRYAQWEAGMNARRAWPRDPDPKRERLKQIFRAAPYRGAIAFLHSYVIKRGFLDGRAGFCFAASRWRYYSLIAAASSTAPAPGDAGS